MTLESGGAMRSYKPRSLRGLAALSATLLLGACGGGGGDGDANPGPVPPTWPGNPSAAIVSASNASQITAGVVGSDDTSSTILGAAAESGTDTDARARASGAVDLALRLKRGLRGAIRQLDQTQRLATAVQVNQTDPCDNGVGSVRTSGILNDATLTGTLSINFDGCLIGGQTLNGPATLRVDAFSFAFPQGIPSDSTLSFTRLTIRGPGISVDTGGSVRLLLDFGTNSETVTVNLVSQDNISAERSTKLENVVFVNTYNNIFTPTSFAASVSGRVFHYVHGYVDVATLAPLAFGNLSQIFPDSGQVVLTGDGNRRIRGTALSATQARLELDLDGNSAYEIDARLKWTELSGPVGADLADSDGDGMHNSWELANGLNPGDPADAALDSDGDGFSIAQEYQAGTNPNDGGSKPATVGLSISLSNRPDPAAVGGNLTYTITVVNSSAGAAGNVVVTDTLPADVSLVSATTPGQGNCAGTGTVTCNLGTLTGFGSAYVYIVVTPTVAGEITNSVNVNSSSLDLDLTNNSAAVTTTVWDVVAGTVVTLPSNSDLTFDATTQKIYAAVRGNPGSVVPIDPTTGALGAAVSVGIDPIKLALSDNGQYLYAGLDGAPAVDRINLATQAVDLTIPLGSDPVIRGDFFAEDIAVLPGSAQSIAVSLRSKLVSPRHSGVAIYDDAVRRTAMTPDHTGSNVIEFSASAGMLYGYNNETTESGFRRMIVDSSGVVVQDVDGSLFNARDIKFHAGLVYTNAGRIIDPNSRTIVGTFALPNTYLTEVVPDATTGRAFVLVGDGFGGGWGIRVFDLTTQQFLGGAAVQGVVGDPGNLVRWGAKGLAFRTSTGQVHLIESPALIP